MAEKKGTPIDYTAHFSYPSDKEVLMTRIIDGPRELVWKALTDPKAVPLYWGPRNMETKVAQMDVINGGQWKFAQVDAKGVLHAFKGKYTDVVFEKSISQTFEYEAMPGHISEN